MSIRSDDLPEPDGPVSPSVSPRRDLERDAAQDLDPPGVARQREPRLRRAAEHGVVLGRTPRGAARPVLRVVHARSLLAAVPAAYGPCVGARSRRRPLAARRRRDAAGGRRPRPSSRRSATASRPATACPPRRGWCPSSRPGCAGAGHDVRIVNAGVSGDTTAGGLSRIGWTLTPEVDAVIVALGGNDFLRGVDPEVSRRNLDAHPRPDRGGGAAGAADRARGERRTTAPPTSEAFDSMYPRARRGSTGRCTTPRSSRPSRGTGRTAAPPWPSCSPTASIPTPKGVERIVEADRATGGVAAGACA